MKPKTKYQKIAVEFSTQLPPITKAQKEWAYRHHLDRIGRRTPQRGKITCMECTHQWIDADKSKKETDCPACHTKLKIVDTLRRSFKDVSYLTLFTAFKGQQVIRVLYVSANYCVGYKVNYYAKEVLQRWISPEGKNCMLSLSRHMSFYCDLWNFGSTMEVRSNTDIYHKLPSYLYPHGKYIPELKRNGFSSKFYGIEPYTLFISLLTNNRAETLLKTGQTALFKYFIGNPNRLEQYWSSIRICLRNDYVIDDPSLWRDYIDLLSFFEKDLHNAKYVCPENLHREHDRLVRKKKEADRRMEAEERRKKMEEDEKYFLNLKSKFFGISFTDGQIEVRVLESVQEFYDEGNALHHCLFSNDYHLKPESLILSAHINGKRLETVEVSLSTMKVVQSRGVCNKNTEYHDRILKLVNGNMKHIKKRMAA